MRPGPQVRALLAGRPVQRVGASDAMTARLAKQSAVADRLTGVQEFNRSFGRRIMIEGEERDAA